MIIWSSSFDSLLSPAGFKCIYLFTSGQYPQWVWGRTDETGKSWIASGYRLSQWREKLHWRDRKELDCFGLTPLAMTRKANVLIMTRRANVLVITRKANVLVMTGKVTIAKSLRHCEEQQRRRNPINHRSIRMFEPHPVVYIMTNERNVTLL